MSSDVRFVPKADSCTAAKMPPEYDYSGAVVCTSQVVHADQIPFMAMSSRERPQCATSFKGRLVTYIADVRVMSALTPKADIAQLEEHVRFVGRLRAKTNGLVAARPDAYLANIAAE